MELISSQSKLLVIAIVVLLVLFQISITYSVREPSLATATPRPPAVTATIITNGIKSTEAAIPPN